MYPFPVNTNICVPHSHNFSWLFYNDQRKRESSTWTILYFKMKGQTFFPVEENAQAKVRSFWPLVIERGARNSIEIQTLITPWLKWSLLSQASPTLRSNIKLTQKQETAKKSMEHSVSGKKSLLQPTPPPASSVIELWKLSCVVKLGTLSSNKTLATWQWANVLHMVCYGSYA